ncbi:WecB/TagA/CpsF family glycosyltransferase [Candidatus Peregrinibacteria bacterium]|nr:WecB/TagA/CpsF family glycosyltransferase [Candidatus Peregrinibacteria bacterium]
MSINILGIPFSSTDEEALIIEVNETLKSANKKLFIATPNPEMVLESEKNEELHKVLNQTDINIPDGTGILWAADRLAKAKQLKSKTAKIANCLFTLPLTIFNARKSKHTKLQRITGTDFMQKVCKDAIPSARIFLLGAAPGIAQKTKNKLQKKYNCTIVGTDAGSAHPDEYNRIRELINLSNPDVLFVAFGAPKQEIWLARNLEHLPSVKVAIGVGGAFDYISGHVPRAPEFMRKIGLEWLYRLLRQPSRIKRIYNAFVKFPIRVIKEIIQE